MSFEFSLSTVLRYRESVERRERLELEKIVGAIAAICQQISIVERRIESEAEHRFAEIKGGAPAFYVQCGYGRGEELKRELRDLQQKAAELESLRTQQMKRYDEARQAQELLQGMRDRQYETYQRNDERRQQRAQDEMSLSRRKPK